MNKKSTYNKDALRRKELAYFKGVPRRAEKLKKGEGESRGGPAANRQG